MNPTAILAALPRCRRALRRARLFDPAQRWWAAMRGMVASDQDRLVLWLPPLLGAGILVYFALRREPPLAAGLLPTLGLLPLLRPARRSRPLHAAVSALLALSVGFLAAELSARHRSPLPSLPRRAVLATGTVQAVDLLQDGRRRVSLGRVTLAMAAAAPAGAAAAPPPAFPADRVLRIRLRPDDPAVLAAGDLVRIRALLRPPPAPDYPGGRDPQRDAFFSGLGGSGRALSPATLLLPAGGHGAAVLLRRLRERIAARIGAVLPGPRGAVAATLLTGLGTAIPQADRDAFAASGLAHLLAVAGLHLGIVMGLELSLVRLALACSEWASLRLPCRQIAALCALAAGAGYTLLTGLHLPGLRALAMATVAMLGLVIGRRAVSLRGLGFAAALLLLLNPATLLDVGFQMSFAAVLALLAGYEAARPLTRRLHGPGWRPRVALHLFQLCFTSLLAGAASLPYAAFHFGRVQFFFVLANLVAVPLAAFWVMPQGLLALAAMPFGLDRPFLLAMGAGIDMILLLAHWVAAFPAASLPVPAPPAWGLLAVSFGLLWLCLWRRRWRALAVLPVALGLLSPWTAPAPDVLVSADAALVGIQRRGGLILVQGPRTDPLTLADWQRALALPQPPRPLPDDGGVPELVCNPDACLLSRRGRVLMLLRAAAEGDAGGDADEAADDGVRPGDCDGIDALVSPVPARGACPGVPRIDRFTVWRNGPQAVWLRPAGVRVWSASADRGDRPWVPRPPGRARPALPLARAE